MSPDRESISTLTDLRTVDQNRRGRAVRRAMVTVLTLFVVTGATGLLGVRTRTTTASTDAGGGYTLSVTHAWISRAGLDTPWQVTVTHPGGFDGPVTLATDVHYFSLFEAQGFTPEPDSETSGGRYVYQQFAPPPGDTLTVQFDAYIQPSSQHGEKAETALLIDGREMTRVAYRTRLVP
ncbi:hypothetical protein GCM10022223_07430 [Kineosporia mesophila]|uniref:DUF1850 domain-containing protein n=1 Tax=Kineosporia mesophila TaxID=566012 RepID=A0ABP6Z006_9ACTN|nr:hypothetical protein [Kineosporia mesophila]MCD5351123.1 hypothetical protein [Kineosporia mesophila]